MKQKSTELGLLETGLVQPVPLPSLDDVLDRVDRIIEDSVKHGNSDSAFAAGLQLIQINRLAGFGLAKFLWRMKQRAAEFGLTEDAFGDLAFDKLGVPPDTTKQYVRAWARVEKLPPKSKTRRLLLERGIKGMIAIVKAEAKLAKNGKSEFTDSQLEKLATAPDHSTLVKTLNEIKGQKPPKNSKTYYRLRRNGNLEYWSNGEMKHIAILFVESQECAEPIDRLLQMIGALVE